MTTPSPTVDRSLRLTVPETGRGQASLWTAAAAPDHRLWTTHGVRWTPPGPHRADQAGRRGALQRRINHSNQRRDDLHPAIRIERGLAGKTYQKRGGHT